MNYAARSVPRTDTVVVGQLSVNKETGSALIRAIPLHLTPRERTILKFLTNHIGEDVLRTLIAREVYGYVFSASQVRGIDTFICHLREKIRRLTGGPDYIETIPGGYKLHERAPIK